MGASQSAVIDSLACDGGGQSKDVLIHAASADFGSGLKLLPVEPPSSVSMPRYLFNLTTEAEPEWRRALQELCRSAEDEKALTAIKHLLFDLQLLGWQLEQSQQPVKTDHAHPAAAQASPSVAHTLQVQVARRFALACEVCVEEDRWQLASTSLSELWVGHHHAAAPKLSTRCLMLPVAMLICQLLEPEFSASRRRVVRKPQTVRVCSSLIFHFMRTMKEELLENHRGCAVEFRQGMHELLRELKRCCDQPAHQSRRGHVRLSSTSGQLTEQEIQDPCFSLCLGFALSVLNVGVLLFCKSLADKEQTETQRWTAVTSVIVSGLSAVSSAVPVVGGGVGNVMSLSGGVLSGLISWAEERTHHSQQSAARAKLLMTDFIQNTQDHAGIERFTPPRLQEVDEDDPDDSALADSYSAMKGTNSAAAATNGKDKHGETAASSASEHSKENAKASAADKTDGTTTKEAAKDRGTETAATKAKTLKASSSSSKSSAATTKADKARQTQAVHGSIYAASLLV